MREILFRGKQIDTGLWVEGYGIGVFKFLELCQIQSNHPVSKKEWYWYDVIPETVGQYTGLNDKNKLTRIFEGDIVRFVKHTRAQPDTLVCGKVFYDLAVCGYCVELQFVSAAPLLVDLEGIEVVGNIHDNPELLEAQP